MKFLRSFVLLPFFLFLAVGARATDLSITAANVKASEDQRTRYHDGKAGVAITAGQVVYQDATDSGKIKLADANGTAAAANVLGIAAHNAAVDQPIRVIIADPNLTPGATLSMSSQIYILSATPGGVAPSTDATTGWVTVVLFVSTSTSTANFAPVRGTAAAVAP